MISAAKRRTQDWCFQQRIHLGLFQVGHQGLWCPLEQDGPYLSTPADMVWAVQADEMSQRMNRCQTLIACPHATPTLLFHVLQKFSDVISRKIFDRQLVNRLAKTTGGKG
jgi:hypothetical protein